MSASSRRELLTTMRTIDDGMLASLSASSVHLVTATQSGLEQLLRQAHGHVDIVMAQHEETETAASDGEDCVMLSTSVEPAAMRTRVSHIVSDAFRTLNLNAHGENGGSGAHVMFTVAEVGEARYRRLKAGFTRLKEHLKDVTEHREMLHRALDQLCANTMILQETCTLATKLSSASAADVAAGLSESCATIEEIKSVLDQEVAKQTRSKLAEFTRFEEKLEAREELRHQVSVAEKKLETMRAGLSTNRTRGHRGKMKRVATKREIAAKKQEFQCLCRRLAVMTEALEHVFQFHFQLDQCIAEPELETVRHQLLRFFQQNAKAFERFQPAL